MDDVRVLPLFKERHVVSNGVLTNVHPASACVGEHCPIHNPSEHPLTDAPLLWRSDRGLMERTCKHGIGHPDPDDIAYKERKFGREFADAESVHGCDGCCSGNGPD